MRLFFAIELPLWVRDKLYASTAALRPKFPRQKWIQKEALHITLRFLGECPEPLISDIITRLTPKLKTCPGLSIEADGKTGFFPNRRRPRVFHAAIRADDNLRHCAQTLNKNLETLGFETDARHPFRPHITLMRFRHDTPKLNKALEQISLPAFHFTTNQISLMQSILKPAGARYRCIHAFKIRSTDTP